MHIVGNHQICIHTYTLRRHNHTHQTLLDTLAPINIDMVRTYTTLRLGSWAVADGVFGPGGRLRFKHLGIGGSCTVEC